MAIEYMTDAKITQDDADRMQAPMELDLLALYKVMENAMLENTEDFEGTPEKLISELTGMVAGPGPNGEER